MEEEQQQASAQDTKPVAAIGFAKRSKNRANVRKRAAEDDDNNTETGEDGVVVRKVKNARDASSTFTTKREDKAENFRFEASRNLQQRTDQGATRHHDVDTERDRDARYVACTVCTGACLHTPCTTPT